MDTVWVEVRGCGVKLEFRSDESCVYAIVFVAENDQGAEKFVQPLYQSLVRPRGFRKTVSLNLGVLEIRMRPDLGGVHKITLPDNVPPDFARSFVDAGEQYGRMRICYLGRSVSITRA